jgi:hypothetical protein
MEAISKTTPADLRKLEYNSKLVRVEGVDLMARRKITFATITPIGAKGGQSSLDFVVRPLKFRPNPKPEITSGIKFGAGRGSRTLVSSLGRIHNSRYTIPA